MASVPGGISYPVSSCRTDPIALLASMYRDHRPHGFQLLRRVQIVIQPMGIETTRMTESNSPLHYIETYM